MCLSNAYALPILKVIAINALSRVEMIGRDGNTTTRHVANLTPCNLPNVIDDIEEGAVDNEYEQISCFVCGGPEDDEVLMLCDGLGCTRAMHTFCGNPELPAVPDGDWLCPEGVAGIAVPLTPSLVLCRERPLAPQERTEETAQTA